MFANKKPIHAGPNAPQYVYGALNLDYDPSKNKASHHDPTIGDYSGDFGESKAQRIQSLIEFDLKEIEENFPLFAVMGSYQKREELFRESGMSREEYYQAEDEELDEIADMVLDYVKYEKYYKNQVKDYRKFYGKDAEQLEPKPKSWGKTNETISCGAGMKFVSCESHGGFLLSPAREHVIPVALRPRTPHNILLPQQVRDSSQVMVVLDMTSRAYEEDYDHNVIGVFFPHDHIKIYSKEYQEKALQDIGKHQKECLKTLLRYRSGSIRSILEQIAIPSNHEEYPLEIESRLHGIKSGYITNAHPNLIQTIDLDSLEDD